MNHIEKYKRQIATPRALGPNDYIRGLSDDDYRLLGIHGVIDVYETVLAIENYRFNGPLHLGEKNAYLERVRKTSFYARMRFHIAIRNLWITLTDAALRGFKRRKVRK